MYIICTFVIIMCSIYIYIQNKCTQERDRKRQQNRNLERKEVGGQRKMDVRKEREVRKEKAREGNGERTERGVGGEERERRYGRTETGVSSKKEKTHPGERCEVWEQYWIERGSGREGGERETMRESWDLSYSCFLKSLVNQNANPKCVLHFIQIVQNLLHHEQNML